MNDFARLTRILALAFLSPILSASAFGEVIAKPGCDEAIATNCSKATGDACLVVEECTQRKRLSCWLRPSSE